MDTKNIAVIKWLIGLSPAKQTKAMLMITIVVLFLPLSVIFVSSRKMNDKLNDKIKTQTEQCSIEKIQLIDKYTMQINEIKDKQIYKLESEKARGERLDSVLRITNRIISKKINDVR